MITEMEDRLSVVPRWAVIRTIQKQTVDQHSFRVALIAMRIAREVMDDYESLFHVYNYALNHDKSEGVTGDIPTTASKYIDKPAVEFDYRDECFDMSTSRNHPGVAEIVKIADLIEAILFIKTEMEMGNKTVREVHNYLSNKYTAFIRKNNKLTHAVEDLMRDTMGKWRMGFPVAGRFEG